VRERVKELAARPAYNRFLADYREPWEYSDAETAAERLRRAGFVDVETSLEPATTLLENPERYGEFVSSVILHRHLERIPETDLRQAFVDEITRLAAHDEPPYSLDYWRLNLSGRAAN
jgi:hypothetical protein